MVARARSRHGVRRPWRGIGEIADGRAAWRPFLPDAERPSRLSPLFRIRG